MGGVFDTGSSVEYFGPASSATSAMECIERKLARLRGTLCRSPSLRLLVLRKRSSCESLSLENSREEDFFRSPNCPFKLFVRPAELLDAMLGAVETRGPGSVLMVPNAESSGTALTEEYESLDAGRADGSNCLLKGLNLGERGDLGDLGDGGALAMRMTGAVAASSGCKNGPWSSSGSSRCVPKLNPKPFCWDGGMVKQGAVCGTSGKPGSDESLESIRGTVSKCEFRGTEMVDSEEISDEMTSGDVGSAELPCPREGSDLRRRRRLSRADSAGLNAGALSFSCMAEFNSSIGQGIVSS